MNSAASHRSRTLYVAVVAIVGVWLFPLLWTALTSVKPLGDLNGLTPQFVFMPTFSNYETLFSDQNYGFYLKHSLLVAGGATIVAMILASLAGYALARARIRGAHHIGMWVLSLRMLPPIATVVPFYLIFNDAKLLDTYFGLILAYMSFSLPFAIWMLQGFFAEVPRSLDEAASADGAGSIRTLVFIVAPVARAGIAVTTIFTFVFAWNEFLLAFILTQSRWVTLPVKLGSTNTPFQTDWGTLTAGGIVAFLPLVIIVFFLQREMARGMTLGAVR
jgi:multiple sugar transport system permease protein